jgi:very-short-patch-repair endonuclease
VICRNLPAWSAGIWPRIAMADITRIYKCKGCGALQPVTGDEVTLEFRELLSDHPPGFNLCQICDFHRHLNNWLASRPPLTPEPFESPCEEKLWLAILPVLTREQWYLFNQVCTMGYRLDFYLPQFRLAVEVDGRHHIKSDDDSRDDFHRSYGIDTVRFGTDEVREHAEQVVIQIRQELERRTRFYFHPKPLIITNDDLRDLFL